MDVIVNGSPKIEVGFTTNVIEKYNKIDIDSALSTESENPVMNKVITAELGKKATATALTALETKVDTNKESTDNALLGLSTKVNNNEADIQSLEKIKANTAGYYPQLHVGLSDNLPDRGDVTEGLIGFRESAGADNSIEDGVANVQELLGDSLVWNQLVSDKMYLLASKYEGQVVGGKYVGKNKETVLAQNSGITVRDYYTIIGHKYLWIFTCSDANCRASVGDKYDLKSGVITEATSVGRLNIYPYGASSKTIEAGTEFELTAQVHDLTQMFEAGKEPSTIEEFNARKNQLVGVDFNAYNEGEVLGVNIKGIKSVNDNAFNGEYAKVLGGREYCADGTITSMGFAKEIGGTTEAIVLDGENKFIPSENGYVYASGTDICIHLVHSGYKDHVYTEHEVSESSFDLTPYFPNGMHGINGVRDSATPKKATRRIGIRDYIEGDENDTLVMTDGKKTIYQLAEPIETEIDPQLNMNYKVWDFGTEELLTDSKSAPVLARTIYGFNATDTIRGNKAKNEEQDVRLQTLESEVVRIGDYQPDLSVGVADQLAGQDEPTASEINFRRSGGGAILDGNARIEAIKGNSVVWNQLWNKKDYSFSNATVSKTNNVYKLIVSKESIGVGNVFSGTNSIPAIEGHKYICVANISNTLNFVPKFGISSAFDVNKVVTAPKSTNMYIYPFGTSGTATIGDEATINGEILIIDLTKMFGAGNEPTTIEEFNARKPIVEDEYAYNEGEVIHMDVQSIESVGVNQWDEEWELGTINPSGLIDSDSRIRSKNYTKVIPNETYYFHGMYSYGIYFYDADKNYITTLYVNNNKLQIPSNAMYLKFNFPTNYGTTYKGDYCINLSDASINGKYFPYVKRMQSLDIIRKYFPQGMKSAGTAHDEIRYNKATQKWEYSKGRIKSVDMGTLNWTKGNSGAGGAFSAPLNNVSNTTTRNVITIGKYEPHGSAYTNNDPTRDAICISGKRVYVTDTQISDVASFKAAMAGVILYYESNDWEWVELDKEDQLRNFDYQVWNCGTEQAIANVPSTPLKADIVYGFNAYGTIKQLKEQMATLMTQMAQMQTAMASVTNNEE